MTITYYGHACFHVYCHGKLQVLMDPFISPNPLAKAVQIDNIQTTHILLSHGHEDHVADTTAIGKRTQATLISNPEIITWFATKGLNKAYPMNLGGEVNIDGLYIKYVCAIHSSSLPDGSYGGSAGAFVLRYNNKAIYFAGDTALTYDMKLVSEAFTLDVALLPIGGCYTMGVEDAIQAAKLLNCPHIIGMHYDTFDAIRIDKTKAINAFAKYNKTLTLMNIGANFEL